jgi:rubrerythrin
MDITNEELLEISTKIEREGKVFYSELAKHVEDPEVKDFLHTMAREEALHEKQFKTLLDAKDLSKFGWEKNDSLKKLVSGFYETDIFPSVDEIFEQLPNFEGIRKALDFALEAEKVSSEFYGLMQESCENIEGKTLLVLLEKAEQEHLEQVEIIRQRYLQKSE